MNRKEALLSIHNELSESGYGIYADLMFNHLLENCDDMSRVIGVAGDDLTGKSSIINSLLGQEILPTSVIPSLAEITITTRDEATITDENDFEKLSELIEETEHVEIAIHNKFMNDNSLIIKEFHGLVGKQKSADLEVLSDAYKCDKMIFIISAEHLLSEAECVFIENYIKYVGAENLLVVINKIDLLADSDVSNVLDYAKTQMETKFKNVKWTFFDKNKKINAENYGDENLKNIFAQMVEMPKKKNEVLIDSVLDYISKQLDKERALLYEDKKKNYDEIVKENKKILQQKKLEEATVEEALIEFRKKKNVSMERMDSLLKEEFEKVTNDLLRDYDGASNKFVWYENELEKKWKSKVTGMSKRADVAAVEIIMSDTNWLNSVLETKLGLDSITLNIVEHRISDNEKLVPYNTYKKFVPIGTGGVVVVGFCLFRMLGAVIGLGGGLLAYTILEMKDTAQSDEIKRQISSKIRDISDETRKMSSKELETVYKNIISEFEKEAKIIINTKYKEKNVDKDVYDDKIILINSIISHIEEVI